jgi:hypothetical protein
MQLAYQAEKRRFIPLGLATLGLGIQTVGLAGFNPR